MGRRGVIVLLMASTLAAQDVESLHQFNAIYKPNARWNLQGNFRLRSNRNLTNLFELRGGPVASYTLNPRLSLIAGYYYTGQEPRLQPVFLPQHRGFGGFQTPLIKNRKMSLEARTLVERFFKTPSGSFTRTRQRLYWQRQRAAFMPYASVEGLYARQRATFRLGVGFLRQLSPKLQMGIGYEMRQYANGSLGHILTSNFQLEKSAKTN